MFGYLKQSIRVPILVTQHMPATFTTILAQHIQRASGVECREGVKSPPVNYCRPAVDPMLDSVAETFGRNALAIILTGMGGRKGCESITAAGGTSIAQDGETSVVWDMPGAAANAGVCSAVLPIDDIAPWVKNFLKGRVQ